jgi:Myb/SANT-like DNA-binding domain
MNNSISNPNSGYTNSPLSNLVDQPEIPKKRPSESEKTSEQRRKIYCETQDEGNAYSAELKNLLNPSNSDSLELPKTFVKKQPARIFPSSQVSPFNPPHLGAPIRPVARTFLTPYPKVKVPLKPGGQLIIFEKKDRWLVREFVELIKAYQEQKNEIQGNQQSVDWEAIAKKVTIRSGKERSAMECRKIWEALESRVKPRVKE